MPHDHYLPGSTVDRDAEILTLVSHFTGEGWDQDYDVRHLTATTMTSWRCEHDPYTNEVIYSVPKAEPYPFISRLVEAYQMSTADVMTLHLIDVLISPASSREPTISTPVDQGIGAVVRLARRERWLWQRDSFTIALPIQTFFAANGHPVDDSERAAARLVLDAFVPAFEEAAERGCPVGPMPTVPVSA